VAGIAGAMQRFRDEFSPGSSDLLGTTYREAVQRSRRASAAPQGGAGTVYRKGWKCPSSAMASISRSPLESP